MIDHGWCGRCVTRRQAGFDCWTVLVLALSFSVRCVQPASMFCAGAYLVANSGRHGQERPPWAWLKSWLAHHRRCWSLRLLHFAAAALPLVSGVEAAPRTPNPLIVGPICSMLLVDARKPYISWAFATLWSLVAVTRLLTLPVESRPVSRTESPSCAVAGSSRVDGYVSSWTQLHIRTQGYELVCRQFIGVRGRSAKRGRPMLRPSTDASVLL
jgi:hypothetical protein